MAESAKHLGARLRYITGALLGNAGATDEGLAAVAETFGLRHLNDKEMELYDTGWEKLRFVLLQAPADRPPPIPLTTFFVGPNDERYRLAGPNNLGLVCKNCGTSLRHHEYSGTYKDARCSDPSSSGRVPVLPI